MDNLTNYYLHTIILQLKELNNRVVSRTNSNIIITHDTAKTKKYSMTELFGEGAKANDLTILDIGGGFTIAMNGESHIPASLDLTVEDEDIYEIELIGLAAGTAVLRLGAYVQKWR